MKKYIVTVLGCTAAAGLIASPAFAQSHRPKTCRTSRSSRRSRKPAKTPVHRHEDERAPAAAGSSGPAPSGSQPNSAASIGSTPLPASEIESRSVSTSDTASLLADIPGVGVFTNGGASGLPTIHGFADDRLRIKVDGMDTIASCPNHMNPALSYIDPSAGRFVQVWTGVTPVSIGGDLLGGAIVVNSREPLFAAPGQDVVTHGSIGSFYRSNGDGMGGNVSATAATEHFFLSYEGAYAKSGNYFAGGDFVKFPLTSSVTKVLPKQ